jgi:phosphatidylglycerophosphate synthase
MRIELGDVIKSRDVEDPVNLHLHRPLQLRIVRLLAGTAITPNQITFLSLCAGLGAAAGIFIGTRTSLVTAACLMFTSAILDGVDGMIARLKKTSSETGHAIDGAADYAVNVTTTAAAIWHIGQATGHPFLALGLGVLAHVAGAHHLMLYDFHCAMYLRFLTGGQHSGGDSARAQATLGRLREQAAPWWKIAVMTVFVWQLGNRERLLLRVNPLAAGLADQPASGDFAARYVASHRGPMRVWALLGNALHMDLMALGAAFDRLELYFAARIVCFSLLGVIATIWERKASRKHLALVRDGAPA